MNIAWKHDGEAEKTPLHYKGCGLPDVYLVSGYEIEETPYGRGVRIKNLDALHREIARYLVDHKKNLSGPEIRFLRHQIDLTQSELARLVGTSAQQIARYEKGQSEISGGGERLLRILIKEQYDSDVNVREVLEVFDQMDDEGEDRLVFTDVDGSWQSAA